MKAVSMFICVAASSLSIACASKSAEPAEQSLSPELAAEIEDICGLPDGALSGRAPVADAMPKIACAVEEARKRNVAMGFISHPVEPDR